ncbi:MAG: MgtC/SapB family protein [Dehalococcoidia bacterium]|jgi:putative Mg2+ transporter-C (MgtC) family protein|nr:MgtC/SapB family protein [Dehalococcoidia bacterium]MQY81136.1 MgtC/SapB family protein [Dehalococcoidia bacterium]TET49359.1 MAG: MgtC/SapB family protein [Dehalococcoidia bacterium]
MPIVLEMVLRLLLAAALGAVIGYQRERAGKQAGLRTHILISSGAALIALVSIYGFGSASDPARVAAGVVVGVGFLGAGVILHREGGIVAGLTTAATIWVMAGIGLAAGVGLYVVAAVATAIVLGVLVMPHWRG